MDATDPFSILESAEDRDNTNPLRLITIGVGIENFNDYLLEQLGAKRQWLVPLPQHRRAGAGRPLAAITGWRSPFRLQTRPAPK